MSFIRKHPDFFILGFLALLACGISLPFLNHAFHIDEPLFLRIAEQIKEHPLNPFGFSYLWNLKYEPVHEIAAFSPLFSYYLALVSLPHQFPPETLIHFSLVPFSIIALLSFYALCKDLGFSRQLSLFAALLFASSSAFFVSANMAMPDVASLSMALLSLSLGISGWKKNSIISMILSGFFLGTAVLFRYNAVALIFLFPLLGITFIPSIKRALVPSLVSMTLFLAWMLASRIASGASHATEVVSIFANVSGWESRFWSMNIHLTLCTFIPILYLFLRTGYRWLILSGACFFALDFAFFFGVRIKRFEIFPDFLFFMMGSFCLIVILWEGFRKFRELFREKNRHAKKSYDSRAWLENQNIRFCFFLLWILGVLIIPIIYVQFASKYLLIAQPALIILTLYLFQETKTPLLGRAWLCIPLLLFSSYLVAKADFDYANQYRGQVDRIFDQEMTPKLSVEASQSFPFIWYTGHWGWQYYWEKKGALPLSTQPQADGKPENGDLIATPAYASATDLNPYYLSKSVDFDKEFLSIPIPIRTMNPLARTGFYSNHWGPLPFNFSRTPTEEINLYWMKPEKIA